MTAHLHVKPRPRGRGFSRWLPASLAVLGLVAATPAQEGDPVLGAPVTIDGRPLEAGAIAGALCTGPFRERWLEVFRLEVVAEKERLRRLAADPENAELSRPLRFLEERPFRFVFEDVHTWKNLVFVDTLRELFTPVDPAAFPPATLALEDSPSGRRMLMQLRMLHEARAGEPGARIEEGERQLRELFLQEVLRSRLESLGLQEDPEQLEDGVCLEVGGVGLRLERLWPLVRGEVSPRDVLEAKKWLTNARVLETSFRSEGVWPSAAQRAAVRRSRIEAFETEEELERSYRGMGFPSRERFLQYCQLANALFRREGNELTNEELAAHLRDRVSWMEAGSVDVDLLLVSAWDFEKRAWKPDGWEGAERRFEELLGELSEGRRSWVELLRESSDFPGPIGLGRRKERGPRALRGDYPGSLRTHSYDHLMATLGESVYTRFVHGGSVTDLIFFELEEGRFGAPLAGSRGWMVPYLIERHPPIRRLVRSRVDSPRNRGIYMSFRLIEYLEERIAECDIRGL